MQVLHEAVDELVISLQLPIQPTKEQSRLILPPSLQHEHRRVKLERKTQQTNLNDRDDDRYREYLDNDNMAIPIIVSCIDQLWSLGRERNDDHRYEDAKLHNHLEHGAGWALEVIGRCLVNEQRTEYGEAASSHTLNKPPNEQYGQRTVQKKAVQGPDEEYDVAEDEALPAANVGNFAREEGSERSSEHRDALHELVVPLAIPSVCVHCRHILAIRIPNYDTLRYSPRYPRTVPRSHQVPVLKRTQQHGALQTNEESIINPCLLTSFFLILSKI